MATILGIVTIIILSVLGTQKSFTRLPFIGDVNIFFLTGTEFLIVGVLLGPVFTGMITTEVILGMYPFVGLGLGWLGMLYGLQFHYDRLIRIPKEYIAGAFMQSAITFIVIFSGTLLFFRLSGFTSESLYVLAILLASIGSCSSQTAPGIIAKETRYKRSTKLKMIRYFANIGDIPGLIMFGFMFCFLHDIPPVQGAPFPWAQWMLLTVGLGLAFGWIMIFLLRLPTNRDERLLFALGIVLCSGGLTAYLRLSPLFVNFIAGVIIANFCRRHHLLDNIIATAEKPIYLILLVLAGSMWPVEPLLAFGAAALFFILRITGKALGGLINSCSIMRKHNVPGTVGFGLINQGGMALAMIINFQVLYSDRLISGIMTAVLVAIIVSELVGQRLIYYVLSREPKK